MTEKLIQVLREMDPLDDDQWTTDGAPRMGYVQEATGNASLTRKEVVEAAPDFNRETAGNPDELLMNKAQETTDLDSETLPDPELPEDDEDDEEVPMPVDLMSFLENISRFNETQLEQAKLSLSRAMDQCDVEIEDIKKHRRKLMEAVEVVAKHLKILNPNSSPTTAIRAYIESQNADRARRVGRRLEVMKHLDPKDIDPRAPIDRAFARKTQRGTDRPVR